MEIYKTVVVPEKKQTILEKILCDKCDGVIVNNSFSDYESYWFNIYNGTYHSNGTFLGSKYKMDLCLNCSLELVDNLEKLGYKIQKSES